METRNKTWIYRKVAHVGTRRGTMAWNNTKYPLVPIHSLQPTWSARCGTSEEDGTVTRRRETSGRARCERLEEISKQYPLWLVKDEKVRLNDALRGTAVSALFEGDMLHEKQLERHRTSFQKRSRGIMSTIEGAADGCWCFAASRLLAPATSG